MNFSKSKYCTFCLCPKLLWLKEKMPEAVIPNPSAASRIENGHIVGELAKNLFGKYVDVTAAGGDGKLNYAAMIAGTKSAMAAGEENICEAAFSFGGLYCAVDILHRENGGYAVYEVKSTTNVEDIHLIDAAYQKYVLLKCGVNVTGVYIVHINKDYIRKSALNLQELFAVENVSELIEEAYGEVEENLACAECVLASGSEPEVQLAASCKSCDCQKYCFKNVPYPSVFDIYNFRQKDECYQKGIISFEDALKYASLKDVQRIQVETILYGLEAHIDREGIAEFLNTLSYPLYFLDFETMQLVIPQFENSKPNEQIPFQYSLHYIESEGGELKHKEFLGASGEDPRRAVAEYLVKDIPKNVCVLAYNKSFECSRIKALAELFPDLSEHLMNIRGNIKDLLDPFKNGCYYNAAMGSSFSIKSVLPAIFPDDPALDYHNLEGVHNGGEVMDIFPKIKDMSDDLADKARHDLLEYCKLDTFAMVKIWRELLRAAQG